MIPFKAIFEEAAFDIFWNSWYFKAIISLVSSSIGIIVGIFIKRWHIRYQMRINTALELRDAFIDEMALLQSDRIKQFPESNRANDIIEKALPKHHKAILRYGVLLSRKKRKQLESIWADYSCKDYWDKLKEIDDDDYTKEDPFVCYQPKDPNDRDEELQMRKLALKRIDKMFKIV